MNLKEFKRRFMLGLIEPELFYLPVKSNEPPKISWRITVALTSFGYYNYNTNMYGGEMPAYGAIVVINSKGQVVFSSKKYKDIMSFSINNLPYGVYYVKVIRSSEYKVDNVWHKIIINQTTQMFKIHLDWQGIYKTHTYLKDDVVKTVILGNKQNDNIYINDLIVKGYAVNDYYIDDKLIWSCSHKEDVFSDSIQ